MPQHSMAQHEGMQEGNLLHEPAKVYERHTKRRQICADGTVIIGHIQACPSIPA